MSFFHRLIATTGIYWIAIGFCQSDQPVQPVQPVQHAVGAEVRWFGGEVLSGSIESVTDRFVRLQSRAFRDPIEIDRQVLESIQFVWPAQSLVKTNPGFELVLNDGSRLHTDIDQVTDRSIHINDVRFGRVTIPIERCRSLRSLGSVEYEWAGYLADWQRVDSDDANSDAAWYVDEKGALATASENAHLWMPLELNESFSLFIRLAGKAKPDFMVSTGLDSETSLRVGTIGENLIIGTADDFEIAGDVAGPVTLYLVWNSETNELSLYSAEGKLLAKTLEKKSSNKHGLLLHNQGKQLSIDSLRVSRGCERLPILPEGNPSGPVAFFSNGSRNEIRAVELNQGKWLFVDNAGESFAPSSALSLLQLKPSPLAASKPLASGANSIRWRDGSTLFFDSLVISDGALRMTKDGMPTLACAMHSIDRIWFSGTPLRSISPGKLTVGNARVPGELKLGDADSPLLWQCVGQNKPVPLTTRLPLEVAIQNGESPKSDADGFQDILYLANGDVLPCSIVKMDSVETKVTTPLGGASIVPNVGLMSVEFDARGTKLRHAFTKESREMMLTLPRTAEPSLATHVLLGLNGDLLRGNVVSLSKDVIEVDSKQEPMLIDRESVVAIAFLAPIANSKETVNSGEAANSDATSNSGIDRTLVAGDVDGVPELVMKLKGGYRLTARFLKEVQSDIHCESKSLGQCIVPFSQIEGVSILKPDFGSDLSPYSDWAMRTAISPRWANSARSESAPSSMLGKKVADFELSALDGTTFKLSEYAGRVVVLDFWATWCGPCVASLPEHLEAMREFAATDAIFVGVNSTETPEVVRSFIERKAFMGFNSLFDYDQSLTNAMGVGGIPHTVVIGPSGEVAHVHVGYTVGAAKEVAQVVRQLLKK